jgi:hypothetical protein
VSGTVWVEVPADWVRVQGLFTFVGEPGRAVTGPVLAIEPDAPGDPAELRRLKDAVCVGCMERKVQRDQWAENSRLNGVNTEQAKEAWYREKDRADQAEADVARLTAGASDEPRAPGTWRTPGQWIQMWNEGSAEDRLSWASVVLANSQTVDEYFRLDYKARALDAEAKVADLRRRLIGGLLVELPVTEDHRAPIKAETEAVTSG